MNKACLMLSALLLIGSVTAADSVYKAFWSNDFGDLDGWSAVRPWGGANYFYNCGGTRLVGGFNIFGTRTTFLKTIPLPPHYKVQFRVQFWKIDSWDNEWFWVWVDQANVFGKQYMWNQGTKICGGGVAAWVTFTENIDITVDHTGNSATFVMTSNLDEGPDNESWGVRNIEVLVEKCPAGCVACNGPNPAECTIWTLGASTWAGIGEQQAEGWTVAGAPAKGSSCGGIPLFGGPGVFGKGATITQQFTLPGHYKLKAKFLFVKIDSWDNERASVSQEGTEIWAANFQYNQGYWWPICGTQNADWRELAVSVDVTLNHQALQPTFKITSNLDEDANNEAWGVRDFALYVAKCAANCDQCTGPNGADCQKCTGQFVLKDGSCQAPRVCAILYSECNYGGASYNLCDQSPNFQKDQVPPVIKSVKVPPNGKVTLFEQNDYGGRSVVYTESQPCIDTFQWQGGDKKVALLQISEGSAKVEFTRLEERVFTEDEVVLSINNPVQFLQ